MTNVSATADSLRGHINGRCLRVTSVLGQLCLVNLAGGIARGPRHFVSAPPSLDRSSISGFSPLTVQACASSTNGGWIEKWKRPTVDPSSGEPVVAKRPSMDIPLGDPVASRPLMTEEQTNRYNAALQFRLLQQARIDKLV